MSEVGSIERKTQDRVVKLFRDQLKYSYLGDWQDRPGNSNVEEGHLRAWLKKRGQPERVIDKVIFEVQRARAIGGIRTLYDANREFYNLLRYGVKVKPDVGDHPITIYLIDWIEPAQNDFAIAEEVTVEAGNKKRPDIVLYVNGIALGILELKRSTISVKEGIRQNLDNQKKEFIRPFFSTVQLIMAGNDTEGLSYAVIETPEKYYLTWKEPGDIENPLDRALTQLCSKDRLLEIIHDFMVFDAGIKKTCRHNQYFGVRAAQEAVRRREGGIIWHTQGSGKSLIMVWLARWIREHVKDARVILITDRNELDEQIEAVFKGVNEKIYRTKSGADLVSILDRSDEWLVCSLVHKFGASEDSDIEAYIKDIQSHLPKGFYAKGEPFVFVDECHRTQSGKLHQAMKAILPGAMFIGFTGTPLLKTDKQKSIEVFGPYIHWYKYDQAVKDGVVLDLRYEARDIDQRITSQAKVDTWFDTHTKGLSDLGKAELKRRWGTMQQVLSSKSRLDMIVADIVMDMGTRPRLMSGHGNALLVSSSIYQACKFYELFQKTALKGKCAIVTSYKPSPADMKGEESGEGETEKITQYKIYRDMLADHFDEPPQTAVNRVEEFEKEIKRRFVHQPGQMKLLIVVDMLLTGFDAPPATYLYIDKQMHDHGLFQAICRVNRLDGDDKEYGYVVDYKDLFKELKNSIEDYTGEAFAGYDAEDVAGLLKNRLKMARERLEEARESLKALCEPVAAPLNTAAYLHFFLSGGQAQDDAILTASERKRVELYRLVTSFLRSYANLAPEMAEAGYTEEQVSQIKAEAEHFEKVRAEVKLASGDYIDMKVYEPAMRQLLDTYVQADPSETVSSFEDMTLVQLIVERGEGAIDNLPKSIRTSEEAVAETIENNVRKVIIDESVVNPKYYETMSQLLDAIIKERKQKALNYKDYLDKIIALTKKVGQPASGSFYPGEINSPSRRALFDNLGKDEKRAILIDTAIRGIKKEGWRGNTFKEREVRHAIKSVIGDDDALVDTIFEIAKAQRDY